MTYTWQLRGANTYAVTFYHFFRTDDGFERAILKAGVANVWRPEDDAPSFLSLLPCVTQGDECHDDDAPDGHVYGGQRAIMATTATVASSLAFYFARLLLAGNHDWTVHIMSWWL
jgi:hypothetical protein